MFETLEVKAEGQIGQLWLNRPERLNALSIAVLRELAEAARWFDQQDDVRVVVVGGRGRAFCAGADLDGFPAPGDPGIREAPEAGRVMADAIEGMRAVTVARVQGWCIGGGVVLASACDLRVATSSARFSIPEVALGIPLAWGGIPRLVREIGPALTRELVITCREFDAQEARSSGFLNRVVVEDELDAEVEALVAQVASKPALPVMATKAHVAAVTTEMVSLGHTWSDADGLVTALLDPEGKAARDEYMKTTGH